MADTSYYGNATTAPPPPPPTTTSSNNHSNTDQGKIFVGGLSWQTTEESLRWHFEQYGRVLSVELMKDRNTGKPRGFGFVSFAEASTVDLVMEESNHEVNHKIVDVKRAQARGVAPPSIHHGHRGGGVAGAPLGPQLGGAGRDDGGSGMGSPGVYTKKPFPSSSGASTLAHENSSTISDAEYENNKVFVGGIPPSIDRDQLKQIFEQFGPVQDAVVMLDQNTQRSRGFGFVTFEIGSNGAQLSIQKQPLPIQGRSVEVKLATPRAEQKRPIPPAPKHLGLRAGQSSSSSTGEFAGLAVAYGRSGWKAGFASRAFGPAGWAVQGWQEENDKPPIRGGFSFDQVLLQDAQHTSMDGMTAPQAKRPRLS